MLVCFKCTSVVTLLYLHDAPHKHTPNSLSKAHAASWPYARAPAG